MPGVHGDVPRLYRAIFNIQEKIPKRVCQFSTKIPETAIISVTNSR